MTRHGDQQEEEEKRKRIRKREREISAHSRAYLRICDALGMQSGFLQEMQRMMQRTTGLHPAITRCKGHMYRHVDGHVYRHMYAEYLLYLYLLYLAR